MRYFLLFSQQCYVTFLFFCSATIVIGMWRIFHNLFTGEIGDRANPGKAIVFSRFNLTSFLKLNTHFFTLHFRTFTCCAR